MAFPKKAMVVEERDDAHDIEPDLDVAVTPRAAVDTAASVEAVSQSVEEDVANEQSAALENVAEETAEASIEGEATTDLNAALLGAEMSLSEDHGTSEPAAEAEPKVAAKATPTATAAPVSGTDDTRADKVETDVVKPFTPTPRLVGDGTALSQDALRDRALKAKQEMMRGAGGGGGGGIVGAITGSVGALAKGAGKAVKVAGGQRIADRFLEPSDPISIAERSGRMRYNTYNQSLKEMGIAAKRRENAINRLNQYIETSPAGQELADMAAEKKLSLADFMRGVSSGQIEVPEAKSALGKLEKDVNVYKMANMIRHSGEVYEKAQGEAVKMLDKLQENHASKHNLQFESSRLADAVDAASESKASPLPLKAKGPESGETIDTEENQKKFKKP